MKTRMSPARRRYAFRLAASMAGYVITLALAITFVRDGGISGPLAWLLALLPGLCVASVFWAFGRLLVEETDEYQRLLLVRQSLIATGFTLTIATLWGFLEMFGLVPHVDAFYLVVLWFLGLGIGGCFNGTGCSLCNNGESESP